MRVLHVSPTYFGSDSVLGGGERYAHELAKAMAQRAEVALLSFARKASSRWEGSLRTEYLRQDRLFSTRFIRWIRWAEVLHCYQLYTRCTDIALLLGRLFGKKTFCTDLGGGERFSLSYHIPIMKRARAFLLLSEYSRKQWEAAPTKAHPRDLRVIYGGVDTGVFSPGKVARSRSVLFVGRLLPHKGIDYLIDALDETIPLRIAGTAYDPAYLELLRGKSKGKLVTFHFRASDQELVSLYQEALVTVQPSVYETCYGQKTAVPELLGLAALESMACGTPVIVTAVGALPEIVLDGITGFIVPPNNPKALREKILYLRENPRVAHEMGRRGLERVLKHFTWNAVVTRCLSAYEEKPVGTRP